MDALRNDLRHALRTWRRAKGAIAAAILALALGIGANTTIFTVVSALLLKSLPYREPERLVMVWQDSRNEGRSARDWVSPGLFVEWARRSTTLEHFAAVRGWQPNLTAVTEPERLRGALVSASYFDAAGIPAAVGRPFSTSDDRPGAAPVVVLSHGLWSRRFGSQPSIVGQTVMLDGTATEVIGVMPQAFRGPILDVDLWAPIRIDPAAAPRGLVILRVLAKLTPGASLDQARAEMTTIAGQLQREDVEWERLRVAVVPLHEDLVGDVKPVLLVLAGAVALVLLIACANVASLLLARASERRREITIRVALGASRSRIVRQVMAESLLLAAIGGILGSLMAYWGVQALVALAPPSVPRAQEIRLDGTVLLFTAALTFTSAWLAGLVPAISSPRVELTHALREGGRESTGGHRLRSGLVLFEVTVAMTLVIGAGLLFRSLAALQSVDLGFEPDGVLTASISPPRAAYREDEALQQLYTQILTKAAHTNGIAAVAIVSVLPLSGMIVNMNFGIEGREEPRAPGDAPIAGFRTISPAYFAVMGMRIVEGRVFTDSDGEGSARVVIVNRTLAQRYWPGASPIGKRLMVERDEATIVGVVNDVHHAGPAAPPQAELYLPYVQASPRAVWIVARSDRHGPALASSIRSAIASIDRNLPVAQVAPLTVLLGRSLAQPRFVTMLLTGFAVIATSLAVVGIYSVLSLSVRRRTREIGVRIALGATPTAVMAMVLRRSLLLAGGGIVLGAALGAGLSRFLGTLLYEIRPGDPITILGMAVLITVAAIAASLAPARRASLIDPIAALREE